MPRIRILDRETANRIAAGEVVERPVSVVKELVENALDAGARRVTVYLEDGGRSLIRVTDDGCGMSAVDARLAVKRHATSKIRDFADLSALSTLGFRGEALPSIAAVSRLEVVTRETGADTGVRLSLEGGRETGFEETGCAPGTTVTVRDLFFNTPARRQHLRSGAAELKRVSDLICAVALARPEVAFHLRHEGRLLFSSAGRGDCRHVLIDVFGRETAGQFVPLPGSPTGTSGGAPAVTGYVSRPEAARTHRHYQFFYVNRRWVKNVRLRQALEDAYHTLLPVHHFPPAVILLELPSHEVDVNVHPAKAVVRLVREDDVCRAVRQAVASALSGRDLVPSVEIPARGDRAPAVSPPSVDPAATLWTVRERGAESDPADRGDSPLTAAAADRPGEGDEYKLGTDRPLSSLRPVGQVLQTYVLAEGPGGLYVVDQHAAHERIYLERLLADREGRLLAAQPLLVPWTIEMTPGDYAAWEEKRDLLETLGFRSEPFGSRTVVVRSVPVLFGGEAGADIFCSLLQRLQETQPGRDAARQEETSRLVMAACKAAVKARQGLSREEMERLLSDLAATSQPYTCPHGRPTVVRVSGRELARWFRRGGEVG